jgi:hypothetical protein
MSYSCDKRIGIEDVKDVKDVKDVIDFLFGRYGLFFELRENDVDSIGTNKPTKLAEQIINACRPFFEQCNTYVFWSTRLARTEAYKLLNNNNTILDKNHKLISRLFEEWSKISKTLDNKSISEKTMILISYAISRLYALQATKNAIVFLGSDKKTEDIGFHVGNNLWHAELPVLQNNCPNIRFIMVDEIGDKTITHEITKDKLKYLPIWRREIHSMDDYSCSKSFVKISYTQNDYDEWRKEPPRRGILYGRLFKYYLKWKTYKNVSNEQNNNLRQSFDTII